MTCQAPHPNVAVTCEAEDDSPNASSSGSTDPADFDVHVHKGLLRDASGNVTEVCRWES